MAPIHEKVDRDTYGVDEALATHGHVSYLEIPAVDVEKSATFYADVFGWRISLRAPGEVRFDDGSGALIGRWVKGRAASRDPGLLPYVFVRSIDTTVDLIVAKGGEIVKLPYAEGNLWVATFRDPAGNLMGFWQAGPR